MYSNKQQDKKASQHIEEFIKIGQAFGNLYIFLSCILVIFCTFNLVFLYSFMVNFVNTL